MPPQNRASLGNVVKMGDTLASLEALRDYLAEALDEDLPPRDRASLARRLESVLVRIDEHNRGVPNDPDNVFGAAPTVEPPSPGTDR